MKYLKYYTDYPTPNGTITNVIPFVSFVKNEDKETCVATDEPKVFRAYDEFVGLRSIYASYYLTIESMQDESTFYVKKHANPTLERDSNLEYSLDNGETWTTYTMPAANATGASITINNGQKLLLRGNNPDGFAETYRANDTAFSNLRYYFLGTGKCKMYGNIMSLMYKDEFVGKIYTPNNGSFGTLFQGNTSLIEVDLVTPESLNGKESGFQLFNNCTSLKSLKLLNFTLGGRVLAQNSPLEYIEIVSPKQVTDLTACFNKCNKLTTINLSNWDVSSATTMSYMFSQCSGLTSVGNLSKWDVSNVTDMSDMFNQCNNLSSIGDISNWDVSNVTDMSTLFAACCNLTSVGDLSNWTAPKCISTLFMFGGDNSHIMSFTELHLDNLLKNGIVTTLQGMFQMCHNLTTIGDISNWNTSKVTDMSFLFTQCFKLKNVGDLSKWDTPNVTNMTGLFQTTLASEGLDLSNWDTSKVTTMETMFNAYDPLGIVSITSLGVPPIPKGCNTYNMFNWQSNLTTIFASGKISASVSFKVSPLTHDSALILINALDSENTGTLTLSTATYETLSENEIKIATDKGWVLA